MIRTLVLCLLPLHATAQTTAQPVPQSYEFCWVGANGYHMEGRMRLADGADVTNLLTERDVSAFRITGFLDGTALGTWSLADLTQDTAWRLNFDPVTRSFPVGGYAPAGTGQRWNASGAMNDCGVPGFGFNAGNFSQDICVNNTWIQDSIIDVFTPLPAYPLGEGPPCPSAPILSLLRP